MTNEAINELFQPLGYTVKIDALNNVTRSLNTLRYEKIVKTMFCLENHQSLTLVLVKESFQVYLPMLEELTGCLQLNQVKLQ